MLLQDYQNYIAWLIGNFSLAMFVLAIVFAFFYKLVYFRTYSVSDVIFRWVAFFSIGLTGVHAFIMHTFFADYIAAVFGWQSSPFQFEVAMASLGFGLMGLFAFNASYGFRLATVIGNTCWLWGTAIAYVYQMVLNNALVLGNGDAWFWLDVVVPLILILCLIGLKREVSLATSE